MLLAAISLVFGLVSSVSAHGYVQEQTVGGTKYTGYLPYSDPYYSTPPPRIIRKIPGNGPVTNLALIDVQCNGYSDGGAAGSAPAPLVATAAPGSTVTFNWTTWPDSHVGPIITYMAKAPSDITKWNPGSSAVWFKIHHAGKSSSGEWAAVTLIKNKGLWSVTIPSGLKPGQYLIRHEIIALHSAYTYPGAQVYPSCSQIQVTGSGTRAPTSFVSFPGAYTSSTPGIVFDVYQGPSTYPIPGPAVKIPGNGPVTDLSLIDVQCNGWSEGGVIGSAPAPLIATAAPGSTVTFKWTTWPDSHVGPIVTYMAKAPTGTHITTWQPSNSAVWFKIAHTGKSSSGVWAAQTLIANNGVWSVTIPSGLAPGQYIIRHEIIALHAAWSYPGAQVYPSCSQVQITGSGTRSPSSFVSFPGAYTGSTPGIVYDVYTNTGTYPIPGPAV
ncbi:Esterase/lipase/thioesterase [Serendipita sp. 399]|nr:Esterase/lipase/thioesterase [Serendipita sp. 399]